MLRYIYIIVFCLMHHPAGTDAKDDSTIVAISSDLYSYKMDTALIRQQVKKIRAIEKTYPDSALRSYMYLLQYSVHNKDGYGIGQSLLGIGNIYDGKTHYALAIKYYSKAIELCITDSRSSHLLPILYNNIGVIYNITGKYTEAASAYMKALAYKERYTTGEISKGTIYLNLGGIFTQLKQYDKALHYLNSIDESEFSTGDINLYCSMLHNKGVINAMQGNLDESMKYFQQSLKISRQYKVKNVEAEVNIGVIYYLQNKLDLAQSTLLAVLAKKDSISQENKTEIIKTLGEIYYVKKDYSKAEIYLLQSLEDSRRMQLVEKTMGAAMSLSNLYKATGDFKKALQYQEAYFLTKDSIVNKDVSSQVYDLEGKYNTVQKDKELLQKQLLISNQDVDLKKKNTWIVSVSSVALLMMGLFFGLYRHNKQKQVLQQRQLDILQQKREIEQLKSIMDGEEKERARLARELHDGIGGMLVATRLNLGAVKDETSAIPSATRIDEVMGMLQDISSEVRRTAHNLMPDVLINHGLEEAISIYCDQINTGNRMEILIQFQDDFSYLSKSVQLILYRILQELVQNVVKHAHADYMAILVRQDDRNICLAVEDNGTGFDVEEQTKGFGLQNLHFRVHALHGQMSIQSGKGKSTTVFIEFNKEKLNAIG